MMTNDTTTLNGALMELGETMADNLVAKGVTASASDGLTTLAGKILDIQTGGSCYHIEFSEASYTAIGGSATLEIYLQENYAPKSGASVTVTGSDGSVYTGITNSNGVASVTVSNVSTATTFTASYSNVSDTATVTVQSSYLYQSDMTTDDGNWTQSSSSGISVTYGTDGCTVTGASTSDRYYSLNVSSLNLPDSFVVEYDITNYVLGAYNNSTEFCVYNSRVLVDNSDFHLRPMTNNTNVGRITVPSLPIHIRVEVGSDIKTYVNGTLFGTTSLSSSYKYIRFKTYNQRSMTVKNIVISAL